MSKPFDATLKHLVESHPADWARCVGVLDAEAVRVVDAELSTVTAAADKVLLIERPGRHILDLELQSSYEAGLGRRMLQYNVLLEDRHDLPVQSTVLLLRRDADGPE